MNRTEIIQEFVNKLNAKTYLEIGVQRGKNFYQIKAPNKIAVDPKFLIGWTRRLKNPSSIINSKFFEMTSNDFFDRKAEKVLKSRLIDVAFIDGLHTYEQSFKDFTYCAKFLSNDGVILFHDCNPGSVEAAALVSSPEEKMKKYQGKNGEWNGDVWKTILHIRSNLPDWQAIVLDCDFGVGIAVRRKNYDLVKMTVDQIKELDYSHLEKNRKTYLGLQSPEYLYEFLSSL